VNVVVAFAVIIFLFRWVTSGEPDPPCPQGQDFWYLETQRAWFCWWLFVGNDGSNDQRQAALGFRPKTVSPQMVSVMLFVSRLWLLICVFSDYYSVKHVPRYTGVRWCICSCCSVSSVQAKADEGPLADPTSTMIFYGPGVLSKPRIRFWNAGSWKQCVILTPLTFGGTRASNRSHMCLIATGSLPHTLPRILNCSRL
jgi:hypothetical protein